MINYFSISQGDKIIIFFFCWNYRSLFFAKKLKSFSKHGLKISGYFFLHNILNSYCRKFSKHTFLAVSLYIDAFLFSSTQNLYSFLSCQNNPFDDMIQGMDSFLREITIVETLFCPFSF